ncbi:MAG TPA: hypothetical protein VK158_03450 [Acidobacteriota bacterium]|nr:hypothetical protein [Acidobacteriota bacterium]
MKPQHALFCTTLILSIVIEAWVRLFSVVIVGTDGFDLWPPIDNIMHFLWGMNLFFTFVILFKWRPRDALYALIAWHMAWEMVEMIGDTVLTQPEHMLDFFFLDGIKDTLGALAGGGVGWLLVRDYGLSLQRTPYLAWLKLYVLFMLPLLFVGGFFYLVNIREGLVHPSPNLLSIIWIPTAAAASVFWTYLKNWIR